jgi:hypothetical protein
MVLLCVEESDIADQWNWPVILQYVYKYCSEGEHEELNIKICKLHEKLF